MRLDIYVNYRGNCEQAFRFYEEHLGGRITGMIRHRDQPHPNIPADWQEKVMHGSLTIGQQVLLGADVAPDRYEAPKGFSLSLQLRDTTEAERIFYELATDGRVVLPLEKTFWAARFGMVVDRFGIPWLIKCDGEGEGENQ